MKGGNQVGNIDQGQHLIKMSQCVLSDIPHDMILLQLSGVRGVGIFVADGSHGDKIRVLACGDKGDNVIEIERASDDIHLQFLGGDSAGDGRMAEIYIFPYHIPKAPVDSPDIFVGIGKPDYVCPKGGGQYSFDKRECVADIL